MGMNVRLLVVSTQVARGESDTGYKIACGSRYTPFVGTSYDAKVHRASGSGKSSAIMHIGFFACFHGISLERSRFRKIAFLVFRFA